MSNVVANYQEWQWLIDDYYRHAAPAGVSWTIGPSAPSDWWLSVYPDTEPLPRQGWKLHISACTISAEAVLRAVLPVLFAEAVRFKLIQSPRRLYLLNQGRGGFSQIGKFMTVYPSTDSQAVWLAEQLHQATLGMRGPAIPSDRPLLPGSLVYYRYGSFQKQTLQLPNGDLVPELFAPDGSLIPDRREDGYSPPGWAIDPFLAAGIAADLPPMDTIFAQRFIVLETLHQAASGAVARAIDVRTPRLCILKRAGRDAMVSGSGHDARDRLRHEAAMLQRLTTTNLAPQLIDLITSDSVSGDLCLVMEHIVGETLAVCINRHNTLGQQLSETQVVAWGRQLAETLAQLHEQGIVHGDIKLTNVVITPDQRVRLIDFNSAGEMHSDHQPDLIATRGYQAPELFAGAALSISTEIYSLGGLLYGLATGCDPALAPQPAALLDRPIRLLNPAISPAFEAIIVRCLERDPPQRFRSMAELRAALITLEPLYAMPSPVLGDVEHQSDESTAQRHFGQLAQQLGDTICREMLAAHSSGMSHPASTRIFTGLSRNLYDGLAGTVVVLAALVRAFPSPLYRSSLIELTDRLRAMPAPPGATVAGLYLGEAGISAALLAAGLALQDATLLTVAAKRGHWIAALPYTSPALLHGTAGRVLLHLWLWDATGDRRQLDHAVAAGSALMASAVPGAEDEVYWTIPSGYGASSDHAYLGYALGAAGIADALLELFVATSDERFLQTAQQAGRWIARQTVSTLDGYGAAWPERIGEPPKHSCWYHGSGGIGRFWGHCHQLGCFPDAGDLAARAAYMVARGMRCAGSSQAWGLAGNIELLLDLAPMQPAQYLAEAHSLARVLAAFVVGKTATTGEADDNEWRRHYAYMTGSAGLALCFLRLASPQPHGPLLSRSGLRGL